MDYFQRVLASSTSLSPRPSSSTTATTKEEEEPRNAASSKQKKRRLDFSHVHYCGRHAELQELCEVFKMVNSSNSSSSSSSAGEAAAAAAAMTIIVEAPSGMGKTVLLDRFRAAIERNSQSDSENDVNEKPFICRGKFEERTAASEPFAAIVEAVNELCEQIMARSCQSSGSSSGRSDQESYREVWIRRIREGLGDEIVFLEEIFPKMERLLETTNSVNTSSTRTILSASLTSCSFKKQRRPTTLVPSDDDSSTLPLDFDGFGNLTEKEWRFERFRLAFRSLIRIVSTQHDAPLVLLLDDLHWADPDSLTLLQTLLQDPQPNRRFMLLATTRPHTSPAGGVLMSHDCKCCSSSSSCPAGCRHVHLDSSTRRNRSTGSPARGADCCSTSSSSRHVRLDGSGRSAGGSLARPDLQQPQSSPSQCNSTSTHIRMMHLENLKARDITCLLIHLLERNQPSSSSSSEQQSSHDDQKDDCSDEDDFRANADVVSLANLISEKTHGNSFVVLQLIRLLEQEQIIYYSLEKEHWTWNDDESVQRELSMCILGSASPPPLNNSNHGDDESKTVDDDTDNHNVEEDHDAAVVRHIVARSLQRAPEAQRRALITAAIFGVSHFEVTTIVHAMTLLENNEKEKQSDDRNEATAGGTNLVENHDNDYSEYDHGSRFLDGNCNYEDENALDPFQVLGRVREMNKILQHAARNGFVTETSPGHYKFTHDRIREAAYSLLPPDGSYDKQMLHLRIGRQLRSWMDQSSELGTATMAATPTTLVRSSSACASFFTTEESLLLHTTKQLNLGAKLMTDSWEKLDLADQNFLAAELAAKKTSFFPAMEYLQQGLAQLGVDPWMEHYSLAHKLNVALMRIQYSCGRFRASLQTADEILTHSKSFRDRQHVYHTKVLCLVQQERQLEAQDLVLNILDELGHKFPRRFLVVNSLFGMRKVDALLKGMTDDDILNIAEAPTGIDDNLHSSAEFMLRLAEISFCGGEPKYFPIFSTRTLELTLEVGLFSLSPLALVSWGVLQAKACKLPEASRFGRLAVELSLQMHGRQHDTRARVGYWGLLFYWQLPLRDGITPLRQAIKEFWAFGALDYLHLDICLLHRLLFTCGEPLDELARECASTSEFLLDYKQSGAWDLNAPLFQAVLNFIGDEDSIVNPAILSGKYIQHQGGEEDEREVQVSDWTTSKPALPLFQFQFFSMMVAYFFGDLERAERFLSEMQPVFEVSSDIIGLIQVFYSGLVYLARCKSSIYRKQGRLHRRKYKKLAMVRYQQLLKWSNDGAVTCVHMHLLLHAEKRSVASLLSSTSSTCLAKDVEQVRKDYDRAIESAASLGLCHHEALANELAGAYLYKIHGSANSNTHKERALAYLSRAVDLYGEWGAVAKVKDMFSRYSNIFPSSKVTCTHLSASTTSTTLMMKESTPGSANKPDET